MWHLRHYGHRLFSTKTMMPDFVFTSNIIFIYPNILGNESIYSIGSFNQRIDSEYGLLASPLQNLYVNKRQIFFLNNEFPYQVEIIFKDYTEEFLVSIYEWEGHLQMNTIEQALDSNPTLILPARLNRKDWYIENNGELPIHIAWGDNTFTTLSSGNYINGTGEKRALYAACVGGVGSIKAIENWED